MFLAECGLEVLEKSQEKVERDFPSRQEKILIFGEAFVEFPAGMTSFLAPSYRKTNKNQKNEQKSILLLVDRPDSIPLSA